MGRVVLDYAPAPKNAWLWNLGRLALRWWWIAAIIGLTAGIWPFVEPLLQKPQPVYASTGEEYWHRMLKNPIFDSCEIRRTGNEVVYAFLDQHGPVYFRADANGVAERQPVSLDDLTLLEFDDVARKWLPYLKAVTGQDFGRNDEAWKGWIKDHPVTPWGEDAYHRMMQEKSTMYRTLGYTDPVVTQANARQLYALNVEERGHFTWRIGISLAIYLSALALVIRFRNIHSGSPSLFSKLVRILRYGRQAIALGDAIATVRVQLCLSVRLLEGGAEAKELDAKRIQLLQAVNDFSQLAKLRQYMFHVHGIAPECELLPPCQPHTPAPPVAVLCPACGRTVLISIELSMWDGCLADGQGASGSAQHGTCVECGSKLRRSKCSIPAREEAWGPW